MIRGAERGAEIGGRRFERAQAFEELECLAQALDSEHLGSLADHRRFRRVLARQEHTVELARAGQQRGRQRSADPFNPPVESEFAEDQVGAQPRAILQHVLRRENSERERKIERRALLAVLAGARLIVILRVGNSNPEFLSADFTRSSDSLTAPSASPTSRCGGMPDPISISTSTGNASTPTSALDKTLACKQIPPTGC